jgi:hypothetical protein
MNFLVIYRPQCYALIPSLNDPQHLLQAILRRYLSDEQAQFLPQLVHKRYLNRYISVIQWFLEEIQYLRVILAKNLLLITWSRHNTSHTRVSNVPRYKILIGTTATRILVINTISLLRKEKLYLVDSRKIVLLAKVVYRILKKLLARLHVLFGNIEISLGDNNSIHPRFTDSNKTLLFQDKELRDYIAYDKRRNIEGDLVPKRAFTSRLLVSLEIRIKNYLSDIIKRYPDKITFFGRLLIKIIT